MAFTVAERVNIRRFCGYPAYGGTPSSFQSYRFFQAYGTLEYRLSNLLAEEEALVTLEAAIPAASDNLDTDAAAVWKHNKNEVSDRSALFNKWRRDLCGFLGIPAGPSLGDGSLAIIV
jgi:hypothetical protein